MKKTTSMLLMLILVLLSACGGLDGGEARKDSVASADATVQPQDLSAAELPGKQDLTPADKGTPVVMDTADTADAPDPPDSSAEDAAETSIDQHGDFGSPDQTPDIEEVDAPQDLVNDSGDAVVQADLAEIGEPDATPDQYDSGDVADLLDVLDPNDTAADAGNTADLADQSGPQDTLDPGDSQDSVDTPGDQADLDTDPDQADLGADDDDGFICKTIPPTFVINCSGITPAPDSKLAKKSIASGLGQVVDLAFAPGDDDRIFVVVKASSPYGGTIQLLKRDKNAPTETWLRNSEPFLDVSTKLSTGYELGLLSMAFHPDFANNQTFYIMYTRKADFDTIIEEYTVDPQNPDKADLTSLRQIMHVVQPEGNHNGGALRFGPKDGYLYISLGDGGGGGDVHGTIGNGQDRSNRLGSILRIDVNCPDNAQPYGIPPDNPFIGQLNVRPEIVHYGLRNPWRMSFDQQTGDLWIGDVGQGSWEEIDFSPAGALGLNFGWRCREGAHPYNPGTTGCSTATLTEPVIEKSQTSHGFRSIVGGVVYRGCAMPWLRGSYIYSDHFVSKLHRLTRATNGTLSGVSSIDDFSVSALTTFTTDHRGEIYFGEHGGSVYRLVPGDPL